jgi:predicted lactoylglutathione lyase
MKKIIKLTESDLVKIVKQVIKTENDFSNLRESGGTIPKDHPMYNPMYKKMLQDIDGENVAVVKYVPNKELVIDAFGNKYTILVGRM